MFQKILLVLSLFIFPLGTWAKDIVIYHTTDTHGRYFSQTDAEGNQYAGFARLATLLKDTKQSYLLLDSGNFMSGSEMANFSRGMYSIDLMNRIGYKAITIGNHDTDFGEEGLSNILAHFRGDVLAMNMPDINMPYNMYKVGGIKVGVIGVAMNNADFIKINNAPTADDFEKLIQTLKDNGAEVIIILAHDTVLDDENTPENQKSNIFQAIKDTASFGELSLVLGGHSHNPTLVGRITNKDGKGPWVLQSTPYLEAVTKIVIHKNKGKITIDEPEFIKLEGKEDKKINKYLDLIQQTVKDVSATPVNETETAEEPAAQTSQKEVKEAKPEQKNNTKK